MTVEVTQGATTVEQTAPRGVFKRRQLRASSPPIVIEVRIDVNRHDAEPGTDTLPAAPKIARAIEAVAAGEADPEAPGWSPLIGHIGHAVRERIDGIIGTAGTLVEHRIDEFIANANSQIDKLVEDTVTQALDTVIHNVIEARLGTMLGGVTIDLTKLEEQPASATDATGETTDRVTS